MAKNIVVCSDGTGNRGGKGRGTNVWRIYNAIDLRASARKQVAHYDDGVGTEDTKWVKLVTGAFGWGFTWNVKHAYEFLVKNYEPGDDIYLFGFSRGAYTVRALTAFVTTCGVIKDWKDKSERDLDKDINRLVEDYHQRKDGESVDKFSDVETAGPIPIKFIGVWDTVEAIGLPFDIGLKNVIMRWFKFKFKHRDLSNLVENACHALAINDERKTFHTIVWNEPQDGKKKPHIEQVWFAGVHSNVGGGYPKQGMSYVSLEWMVSKVKLQERNGTKAGDGTWGLSFVAGFEEEIRRNANVNGKIYDSRSGAFAYYRYEPRNIGELCKDCENVKIHDSVFDRIDRRLDGYNPGNLPAAPDVEVVATENAAQDQERKKRIKAWQSQVDNSKQKSAQILARAYKWIEARKALHLAFVLFNILVATALGHFLIKRPDEALTSDWEGLGSDIGNYVVQFPLPVLAAIVIIVIMYTMRGLGKFLLCLTALVSLGYSTIALPEGWVISVFKIWGWLDGLLAFLLPDVLAAAVVYFIGHYAVCVIVAVVAFVVMLYFRKLFRRKCAAIFEEACDQLRLKNDNKPGKLQRAIL